MQKSSMQLCCILRFLEGFFCWFWWGFVVCLCFFFVCFGFVGEGCVWKDRWCMFYNNLFKNESHATDINHEIIRTGRDNDEIVISRSLPLLSLTSPFRRCSYQRPTDYFHFLSLFTWRWDYTCSKRARKVGTYFFLCLPMTFSLIHCILTWSYSVLMFPTSFPLFRFNLRNNCLAKVLYQDSEMVNISFYSFY